MKRILITTIAAVVLVGCGNPEADRALFDAVKRRRNIEAVKNHLAAGADVNAKIGGGTPLHFTAIQGPKEVGVLPGRQPC